VLAFRGQHAFALGTVIALAVRSRAHRGRWPSRLDLGERWSSRLVATAAEERLNFRRRQQRQQGKSPGSEAGA